MRNKTKTETTEIYDQEVRVPIAGAALVGRLTIPEGAHGLVIFAHGSGSSRHSPRNWYVAEILHNYKIATLLIDLLTPEEEEEDLRTRLLRFDIPMLAGRLVEIAKWAKVTPETEHLKIGYFGSSTGGGAALMAAAQYRGDIGAIVSRGGRPDLAGKFLTHVKSPSLLIVGERDPQVLALNEQALAQMNAQSELHIIPGATHLFEEPNTLEMVAREAAEWFAQHLG